MAITQTGIIDVCNGLNPTRAILLAKAVVLNVTLCLRQTGLYVFRDELSVIVAKLRSKAKYAYTVSTKQPPDFCCCCLKDCIDIKRFSNFGNHPKQGLLLFGDSRELLSLSGRCSSRCSALFIQFSLLNCHGCSVSQLL